MTEDVSLTKIKAIQEVFEKNLAIVQQALGIEAINNNDLDELAIEPEIIAEKTIANCPKKSLTASELVEEKRHVCAMQEANRAKFLESQALFAESVTEFNRSKDNFVRRCQRTTCFLK